MSNEMTDEQRELRNAMLRAQAAQVNAQKAKENPNFVPQMPTLNNINMPQQQSLEFDLAMESAPIPSLGLVYPEQSALHNAQTVDIKAITPTEENILMNPAILKRGTVISELIKSCITEKTIDPGEMLSGDRNALVVAIRSLGYGQIYTTQAQCPECEKKQEIDVNLNKLKLQNLDLDKLQQTSPFKNEFHLYLPESKKNITFKFLTGREEERLVSEAEARKKKGLQDDQVITQRLKTIITSVENITDRNIINKFVMVMPGKDSALLRKFYDQNEPKIDMTTEFECSNCGHQEVITIPLGPTFLWVNFRS
jgi:hypothetical protein